MTTPVKNLKTIIDAMFATEAAQERASKALEKAQQKLSDATQNVEVSRGDLKLYIESQLANKVSRESFRAEVNEFYVAYTKAKGKNAAERKKTLAGRKFEKVRVRIDQLKDSTGFKMDTSGGDVKFTTYKAPKPTTPKPGPVGADLKPVKDTKAQKKLDKTTPVLTQAEAVKTPVQTVSIAETIKAISAREVINNLIAQHGVKSLAAILAKNNEFMDELERVICK